VSEKDIFGVVSILLAMVSNGAYFLSVSRKKTRPHVFSWTIWGLLTGITFFAQNNADAGPGAWHMAVNSVICFVIAGLAIKRGNLDIRAGDIATFICGLLAIPLWYVTKQPLLAVVLVICVEAFAYYPTFRKSYINPHEELAFTYTVDALRCAISLLAMEHYSLTTVLYPLFIVIVNVILVSMLVKRRRLGARNKANS
jgi:hypothetical protein